MSIGFLRLINACRESLRFEHSPDTREKLQELLAMQERQSTMVSKTRLWHRRERRHTPKAIEETLNRISPSSRMLARAHGRLGTTYAVVGQKQLAVKHLQAAAKYDPDDPYGPAMLGWLAYLDEGGPGSPTLPPGCRSRAV